jgi:hypothetical protein
MPPPAVKTIRDLIYWQYAKIIADSAGIGSGEWRFTMSRFKKLQQGEIEWSGSVREFIHQRVMDNECIYCGADENLSFDHLYPRNRGGPDIADNLVMACKSCNSAKSDKCFYEWWFGGVSNLEIKNHKLPPRVAEGKYLKLMYKLHEEGSTLDAGKTDMSRLCDGCEVGYLCEETSLTLYCLESILRRPVKAK